MPEGGRFTLTEENDDLAENGDQHYTQGLRLSLMLPESYTPNWAAHLADALPAGRVNTEAPRLGLTLGQSIYTPRNIFSSSMIRTDRPYGGWLYLGPVLQRRGLTPRRIPVQDNFEINLGVLGPASLAQQTQTWWHDLGGWAIPRGWRYQLKNEPGLVLKYDRQWKFSVFHTEPESGWGVEIIPHAGVSLGNVHTFAAAGGMLRAGYNIPDDFGVQTIDSLATESAEQRRRPPAWGGYIFAGVDGRAVAHNAFLDGNLLRHSMMSVEKERMVGEFKVGGMIVLRHLDIALSFVERTREFKMQKRNDHFGSLSISLKF